MASIGDLLNLRQPTAEQRKRRRRLIALMAAGGGGVVATAGPRIEITGTSLSEAASLGGTGLIFSVVGLSGPFTWALTADPDNKFDIGAGPSVTEELLLDGALDYETATSHSITVTADDGVVDPVERTYDILVIDEDEIAPTITSSNAISVPENAVFNLTLTADEPVTWTKTGGADQALFTLTGDNLSMVARDYEDPDDADTNNTYVVQVTATDGAGNATNQTITVTVTNVTEDTTPDAFAFVDETNATLNTQYISNEITVAGIDGPTTITVVGGEYRINGGSWVSTAGTVSAGDDVEARVTSSSSYSTAANCTVTIGGVSDTYTVTTIADPGGSTAGEPIGLALALTKAA